jgi:glycosyltransferase involved in cell wall biosynthesis
VPSFSIVIPAFQAAQTIGAALASAVAQTRPALEILVCDDGSTDDLERALGPWRDGVVLLRKENGGAASARNLGTRAARGEFVAFLDADDTYEPRRLEALAGLAAARPDLDLLATDAYLEAGGRRIGRFGETTPFACEDQRTAILRSCFVGGWPAVRRSVLVAAGGFDETLRIAHDWDCWIRLVIGGARAGYVDEPLMTYRIDGVGLTGDRLASLRERLTVLERARALPLLEPERAALEETLARERRKVADASRSRARRVLARVRSRVSRA